MTAAVERLNNAIVTLAWINPANVAAQALAEAWGAWFDHARALAPDAAWFGALKTYWGTYALVRQSASNLSARTPEPGVIDPTIWALVRGELEARGELVSDAGRAVADTATEAGRAVLDTIKPLLFVALTFGGAYFLWGRR
jgi:hypothetical protein